MRKIALVTSTRADYGLMIRLIEKLALDSDIEFYLLVTGTHLSEKFGMTKNEISQKIYKEIDIAIESSPATATAKAITEFSAVFSELKPDLLIVYGDRYEIMGVAQAAMFNTIPIAHLGGGDTTEGAIDEAIRHGITKMSHLHFVTCDEARQRVIQLGEHPDRVFNYGAISVENIKKLPLMTKEQLEESLKIKFGPKNILATFHPVTLEGKVKEQFMELLHAFDQLPATQIIMTCPNSDEGNEEIFNLIHEYAQHHSNFHSYKSLGLIRYLSCMQFVDMVVGNSSSGIYEVPSFKIPTVNIGNRQKGRMCAKSVINCLPEKQSILNAIDTAYKMDCSEIQNPYYKEGTLNKIVDTLKACRLEHILTKEFYLVK